MNSTEASELLDQVESLVLEDQSESAQALLCELQDEILESSARGRALALQAQCFEDLDKVKKAEEYIAATMKEEQEDPAFVLSAAMQFSELGALDYAETFLRNLCEIDSESHTPWYILATHLAQEDRFEEAIGYFEKAIQRDPLFGPAHLQMAESLYELGQLTAAIPAFQRYLDLEPTHTESWKTIANIECTLGNADAAYRAYARALETAEDPAEVFFDWALTALELNDAERAATCVESMDEIEPDTWEASIIRADLATRDGDIWMAWETICQALDVALDDEDEPDAAEYVAAYILRFAHINGLNVHVGSQIDRVFDHQLFSESVLRQLMILRGRAANDAVHFQVVLTGPLSETPDKMYFRAYGVAARSKEDAATEAIEFEKKCIGVDWEVFDVQAISDTDEGLVGVMWRSDVMERPPLSSRGQRTIESTESP